MNSPVLYSIAGAIVFTLVVKFVEGTSWLSTLFSGAIVTLTSILFAQLLKAIATMAGVTTMSPLTAILIGLASVGLSVLVDWTVYRFLPFGGTSREDLNKWLPSSTTFGGALKNVFDGKAVPEECKDVPFGKSKWWFGKAIASLYCVKQIQKEGTGSTLKYENGGITITKKDGTVTRAPSSAILAVGKGYNNNATLRSDDKRLVVQYDGNVVVYQNNKVLWASNTEGNKGVELVFQGDGNLVLYAQGGKVLWSSDTKGRASLATFDGDGRIRLWSGNGTLVGVWYGQKKLAKF